MWDIFSTILLYNTVFFVAFILCDRGEKKRDKRYIYVAYFVVTFISVIRFDIGADYDGYARNIETIALDFQNYGIGYFLKYQVYVKGMEPIFVLSTFLFSWSSEPTFWVFALYSVFTMCLLYMAFDRIHGHKWGLFLFYISCLIFFVWDGLRQGLSMAILLNALPLIKKRKLGQFLLLLLVATLSHYSAMFFAVAYLIAKIKVNKNVSVSICILLFLLAQLDILSGIVYFLVSIAPLYNDYYTTENVNSLFTYHDISYIFTAFWLIYLVYLIPKREKALSNIVAVGAILYILAGGNLNVDRIGYYFSQYQLIALPLIMYQRKTELRKYIIAACLFTLFSLCNIRVLTTTYKECSPYETVFSKEYKSKQYRDSRW